MLARMLEEEIFNKPQAPTAAHDHEHSGRRPFSQSKQHHCPTNITRYQEEQSCQSVQLQTGCECPAKHQSSQGPFYPWIGLLVQNAPPPILSASRYDSPGKIIINEIMIKIIVMVIVIFLFIYNFIYACFTSSV